MLVQTVSWAWEHKPDSVEPQQSATSSFIQSDQSDNVFISAVLLAKANLLPWMFDQYKWIIGARQHARMYACACSCARVSVRMKENDRDPHSSRAG